MDLNDVQAAYLQLKYNVKALTKTIDVLHSLLISHTALKLKALHKIFDGNKMPPPVKGDLVVQLDQMITKKRDILRQNRIHSSTIMK